MSDEDVVSASEAGHTSEGVSDLTMTTYKETSRCVVVMTIFL